MNLKDVIKIFNFDQIKDRLFELYPDQIYFIEEYKNVFNQLKIKKITKNNHKNFQIFVEYIEDESDEEPYYSVYGKEKGDDDTYWGLEFCTFSEWLGFEIAPETLAKYTLIDIICHCLDEMTFISFDEKEIKQHKQKIRRTTDNIKQMLKRKT